jgi:excisionase family DNA binding protein
VLRLSTATAAAIALHATDQNWILFVQCQPPCGAWPIKIEGTTGKKLIDRVNDLAADNPFDMFLVGLVQSIQPVRELEVALHQEFATDALHDGWFAPSRALLSFIEGTAQASLQDLLMLTQPGGLEEVVGIDEIAKLLNVSVPTIRRMVKDGRIPYMRFGNGTLRFCPDSVLASLGEQGRA